MIYVYVLLYDIIYEIYMYMLICVFAIIMEGLWKLP